jgi:hypothetical protein
VIAFKPHTITVQSVSKGAQSKSPVLGAAVSVQGQLTPKMPVTTYQTWGVDLQRPHEFFCEVDDASNFANGYKVTLGSRTFFVSAAPVTFSVGLGADHCRVLLEEQQFTESA